MLAWLVREVFLWREDAEMADTFTYEQALAFIHGAAGHGKKAGLDNMRALLARLGNPEKQFQSVHVAGTNGKGSVCAFIHAGLTLAGKKTGLYTSPFLQRYNERIRVNGMPIDDDALARYTAETAREVEVLRTQGIAPTEFEIGTAIAFLCFAREAVDIAVIEVGLGGRFDSTNVITPLVCAIASIGLDHVKTLGDTPEKIAFEKAGIAKQGVPMILSAQVTGGPCEVIAAHCRAVGAPLLFAEREEKATLGLNGAHQRFNAGVAHLALETLGIPEATILEGLRCARWPARLEWIDEAPLLLLDGAHNPQGAQALAQYVRAMPRTKTVLVCGILRDKDWHGIVKTLAPLCDEMLAVRPDSERALESGELAAAFRMLGIPAQSAENVSEALAMAKAHAGADGRVIVAGSLYLAGEARTLLKGYDDALLKTE